MYILVGILVTPVSSECQNITLVKDTENIHQRVVCLRMAGLRCHSISHCFLLTEALKSEKPTCEVSGLTIKSRLTTCKSAMWTRVGCKKGAYETHWEEIIHRKATKLVIVLMEK